MITINEAKDLHYRQELYHIINRNSDGSPQRWRVNGTIKLWKRDPQRFQVPIKHGLYDYDYLTDDTNYLLCLTESEALGKINTDDEQYTHHTYDIFVGRNGDKYTIHADCEQDAIDVLIDYCEVRSPGYIMSYAEEEEEEYIDEYICGGNHGRYLNTYNIRIEQTR